MRNFFFFTQQTLITLCEVALQTAPLVCARSLFKDGISVNGGTSVEREEKTERVLAKEESRLSAWLPQHS